MTESRPLDTFLNRPSQLDDATKVHLHDQMQAALDDLDEHERIVAEAFMTAIPWLDEEGIDLIYATQIARLIGRAAKENHQR